MDGDTIEVRLGTGTMALVRLIGVNTPESTTQQESFGKEAAAFTETRLLGRVVYLESDVSDKDRFGRLLRYVWLATPAATEQATRDNLFNAILLLEGFAQVATFPPNVKYVDYFTRFQTEAREANRGLWTTAVSPAADKVDINTATIEELKRIIHIDQVRAEEIVRLRPFSSVDDLDRVRGIGPARLADIKEQGIASVK